MPHSASLVFLLIFFPLSVDARLQAGAISVHSHVKKKVEGTIFTYLVKEWKDVPDEESFVKNCTGVVTTVLPQLHHEYTARQVPKILFHECDVYATKTTFKTEDTSFRDALSTCRYCAGRLGAEFLDDEPDYKAWCGDVHSFLTQQSKAGASENERQKLVAEQQALKDQLDSLRREYDVVTGKNKAMEAEIGRLSNKTAECCPAGCRQC